ncbi:MAG: MMPL family transporter [Pirellulales bacterium]|nr:MMPL family transporter [Pirellulales bacterium]
MSQSFFERRSFAILVVAVFLMPFLLRGTRLALQSNRNDVKNWLPTHFEQTQTHRWFQEHFPLESFVLVSWTGATPNDPGCTLHDPRLEMLARKLESRPEDQTASSEPWFFKTVITGQRLFRELQARDPDLTDEQILERLRGSLIGPDDETTCLLVTLSQAAKGRNLRATLEKIRDIADKECAIPRDDIRLGGPPVDNVAIDVEGERTLYRLAGLSAVVGLGISWLCFRDVRLTLLVFLIALLAAGAGLASVYFTGLLTHLIGLEEISGSYGTVDAILLSMPSLVYVLAISGAVHIVNYYHDAVREQGLRRAPERALAHGWLPCALAALTTALGLGSLMASHLIPINKFGIYSAWGVMATLVLLLLFLPACLQLFPSRQCVPHGPRNPVGAAKHSALSRFWHRVGRFVIERNGLVTTACVLLMAVCVVRLTSKGGITYSVKLMKLFSPEAEIIDHYTWLENHIGPLVPMEVVLRLDNERCKLSFVERMRLAQHVEQAVENLHDVGGAISAATFVRDIAPDKGPRGALEKIIGLDRRRERDRQISLQLESHRADLREYLTVAGDPTLEELGITETVAKRLKARKLTSLRQIQRYGDLASIHGIGREGADRVHEAIRAWQSAHGEELWRVSARVWALGDVDYGKFVDELRAQVEPVLAAYRQGSVEGISAEYTGLVPLVYQAQRELMHGLYNSLKWAFVLIALVMIIVLRSPAAGLLAMVPNLFPVVLIFGTMGWLEIPVDVGTMMTASVALGVAVDDTIHFLTWFRRGLDEGRDRRGAVMMAYERCGVAMTQTTLIGGLGLSVFAFSTFTPTQRFGVLMLTLLGAALVGDLVFLPAVLSSPIGRFFFKSKKKKQARDEVPSDDDEVSPDDEVVAVPITGTPSTALLRSDTSHQPTKAS